MDNEDQIAPLVRVIKKSAFLIAGAVFLSGGAICIEILSTSKFAGNLIGPEALLFLGIFYFWRGNLIG
jgi:hypothetical protein